VIADNAWGAAFLCAQVLAKTFFQEDAIISEFRLGELAADYERDKGVCVDVADLVTKSWLRVAFGEVMIPYLTSSAVYRFEKIAPFAREFVFFDALTPDQIKATTTEDELITLAGGPNNAVSITLPQTKNLFWFLKNDKVELPRLDNDRYLLEHQDVFDFLSWLLDKLKNNELLIRLQDFTEIRDAHLVFFQVTPTIEDLSQSGLLDTNGRNYRLNLHADSIWRGEFVRERTAALLWQNLLLNPDFDNDLERLRFWYYRVIYHQGFVDVGVHFPPDALARFLDAAELAVITEPDLETDEREIFKLLTDIEHGHEIQLLWTSSPRFEGKTIDKCSLNSIYSSLGLIFPQNSADVLVRQRCRHAITFFIVQLVKNDDPRSLKRIGSLFDHAESKPFGLWKACLMITHWRPEIIQYLALQERSASLAFALMLKADLTNFTGSASADIRIDLIKELAVMLMTNLAAAHTISISDKAAIIFECLIRTTRKKFRIEPQKADSITIDTVLREIISATVLPGTHYDGARKVQPLFISVILADLSAQLEAYQPHDPYRNGMLGLPVEQLDLAEWLMNLPLSSPAYRSRLAAFFTKTYLSVINTKTILQYDFFGDRTLKLGAPSWYDQRPNDELIAWDRALLCLEQNFELDAFLNPIGLVFNTSTDRYDEANRFVAQKLRTHLYILLDAISGLYRKSQQYEHEQKPLADVSSKLEQRIHDAVIRYSVNDPAARRYDIFNEQFERWFGRAGNKELLPIIGSVINRFSSAHRETMITALMQSEQLIRSLKLLDHIISEKERRRLLKVITDRNDFASILEKLSFQDMQFVVSALSEHNDFVDAAESALAYAAETAKKHTHSPGEGEIFVFRMQLLLAFQKRDISAIDGLASPTHRYVHGQAFNPEDEKDFYRALIYLKTGEGKRGYEVYDRLANNAGDDRPVLALNRFAAKLQWAAETSDLNEKKALAYQALTQWDEFDKAHPKKQSWPDMRDNIWFDRLDAYELLEDYDGFDQAYAEVDENTRMRPDFLDIRTSVLLRRNMQRRAADLLGEARRFHRLSDGSYPDFIETLEKRINTPETIAALAAEYDIILRLPPEELIQVIPTSGSKRGLSEALLEQLINASADMLNLINSLPQVDQENKYSDLVMLSLNGRMSRYGWHVASLRSGFPDSEDLDDTANETANVGLVDFGILTGERRLAICEALILEGLNTIETQKHNLKIFNYDPARKLFYLLIYFKGATDKFADAWSKYCGVVEDFIEFPKNYLPSGKVTQLAIGQPHDGILIGSTLHGKGTQLYHLFVNVNYRLTLVKKMVSQDRKKRKEEK